VIKRFRQPPWSCPFDTTTHTVSLGDARHLSAIADSSVHLVVTSPPYWTLKEYPRVKGQLGRVEDYETFLRELDRVWTECERVLVPGGRICCVVGNVRVPRRKLGRHLVAPLPADVGNVVTYAINFGALIQRHMQTRRRHPTPGVEFNVNKRREVGTVSSVTLSGQTGPALAILETA
jgi:DNA modification methylase